MLVITAGSHAGDYSNLNRMQGLQDLTQHISK
jgi:hypothetical protein